MSVAAAAANWSGASASPWPKPIVMVSMSPQRCGQLRAGDRSDLRLHAIGQLRAAAGTRESAARPASIASLAAPMFEECTKTSVTESGRPSECKSLMVKRPAVSGSLASTMRVDRGEPLVDHHGERNRLENRPELERAAGDLVAPLCYRGSLTDTPDQPPGAKRTPAISPDVASSTMAGRSLRAIPVDRGS